MMYLKHISENGEEKIVEIHSDEIFTLCSKCGKEIKIDFDFLLDIFHDDGDFSSSVCHLDCIEKYPKLVRVK